MSSVAGVGRSATSLLRLGISEPRVDTETQSQCYAEAR